jgi:hypothetical protein
MQNSHNSHKWLAFSLLLAGLFSLLLVACGEPTSTSLPTPLPTATAGVTAAATSATAPRIISEQDNDATLQLKVGESLLAGFSPEMAWDFKIDAADGSTKNILTTVTQGVQEPYQARFQAQSPGTAIIKAEGSCKPAPGKLCHQAIITYDVTVKVS